MTELAPIALALDAPDLATACGWANAVNGVFSHVKVGLETYLRDGAAGSAPRSARPLLTAPCSWT